MPFPDTQREPKTEPFFQFAAQKLTNVLDRRIFEEIVPGSMVVTRENLANLLLEVSEIDDHTTFYFAFYRDFDLIGMAMQGAALGMAGKKMSAVNVVGHTNLHGVRIT